MTVTINIDGNYDAEHVASILRKISDDVSANGLAESSFFSYEESEDGTPLAREMHRTILKYKKQKPLLTRAHAEFTIDDGIIIFAYLGESDKRYSLESLEALADKIGEGQFNTFTDEIAAWGNSKEGRTLLNLKVLNTVGSVMGETATRGERATDFYQEVYDHDRWEALRRAIKKKITYLKKDAFFKPVSICESK